MKHGPENILLKVGFQVCCTAFEAVIEIEKKASKAVICFFLAIVVLILKSEHRFI